MTIGPTLRIIRKKRGILQKDLSEACSLTQSYLSQIENNKREPTIATLREICNYLEVPLPAVFLLSIEDDDLPAAKREAYQSVLPAMKLFIDGLFIGELENDAPASA